MGGVRVMVVGPGNTIAPGIAKQICQLARCHTIGIIRSYVVIPGQLWVFQLNLGHH